MENVCNAYIIRLRILQIPNVFLPYTLCLQAKKRYMTDRLPKWSSICLLKPIKNGYFARQKSALNHNNNVKKGFDACPYFFGIAIKKYIKERAVGWDTIMRLPGQD